MNVVYHILDFERQTKAEEERGGQTHEDEHTPGLKETDPDPEDRRQNHPEHQS